MKSAWVVFGVVTTVIIAVWVIPLLEHKAEANAQVSESVRVTDACNKYYAELMEKTNTNTIYVGTIRAMFMLDKLKCDIPARVSGAFPQP